MTKKIAALLAAALLLALCVPLGAALADATPEPTPTPTRVPAPEDGQTYQYLLFHLDDEGYLLRLKGILKDNGYYASNIPDTDIKSSFFDRNTLIAINVCCERNGLPTSEAGILAESYARIMEGNILKAGESPSPSPSPTADPENPPIPFYAQNNPNVTAIQQKLGELGYDQDEKGGKITIVPGLYDYATRAMVEDYAGVTGRQMSEDGEISTELQTMILNDSTPRSERVKTRGGLAGWFLRQVSMFGLPVPRYVECLVSLALIAAIAVAAVGFFGPRTSAPAGDGREGAIEFTIEYNGASRVYRCDIDAPLRVGRGAEGLPLEASDGELSRNHCEIYRAGGALMLRDHSTNGTFLNGRRCGQGEAVLHSGDVIRVGSHHITIRF